MSCNIIIFNFSFQIRCPRMYQDFMSSPNLVRAYLQYCKCCTFYFVIQLLSEPDKLNCNLCLVKVSLSKSRESCTQFFLFTIIILLFHHQVYHSDWNYMQKFINLSVSNKPGKLSHFLQSNQNTKKENSMLNNRSK